MSDFVTKTSAETGDLDLRQESPRLIIEVLETETRRPLLERLLHIDASSASYLAPSEENNLNEKRLEKLRRSFTTRLLTIIQDEEFEYGLDTKADILVREQMKLNALATKSWLNSIFVEAFDRPVVLAALLRVIARLDYLEVYPEGQTMAVAALSNSSVEVQECGIRAFESWATLDSLHVLESLQVSPAWLQEYVDEVVSDLRKEHNVSVG